MANPKSGQVGGIAVEQVRSIVERAITLHDERQTMADDIALIFAEAKSNGHDKKALQRLVAKELKRRKDPSKFNEEEGTFDVYERAYYGADSDEQEAA